MKYGGFALLGLGVLFIIENQESYPFAILLFVTGIILLVVDYCLHKKKHTSPQTQNSHPIIKREDIDLKEVATLMMQDDNNFTKHCADFIEKIIFLTETKKAPTICTNNKSICDFIIFAFFFLRLKLCNETININFISHFDKKCFDILPQKLSTDYLIDNAKELLKQRLDHYDNIMQQSNDKHSSLFFAVKQFILKDIHSLEEDESIFIQGLNSEIDLHLEIQTTLYFIDSCIVDEYNQVKSFTKVYSKKC